MRRILILSFLLIFTDSLFCADPLGKVVFLRGFATMTDLKTKHKTALKTGDPILEGTLIKTEKNSRILIELSGGIKKLLPENTELYFFTRETLKLYQKTDQSINKTFALTGKKASNAQAQISQEDKFLKEIKDDFLSSQYLEIIDKTSRHKISETQPELLYMQAVSYLKLGVEKESVRLFQQLIDSGIYEYKKIAYFGLFIAYFRTGEKEKSKSIYEQFREEGSIAEEMEHLLEE